MDFCFLIWVVFQGVLGMGSGLGSMELYWLWFSRDPVDNYLLEKSLIESSQNQVRNGHIKRITDNDIQSLVLEIISSNVSTTYITCPADPKKTLGIKLPFLVMIIKNLKKYFTFEVQVNFFLHSFALFFWDFWIGSNR